ncbi:MAG: glycosyltransferase, partial [Limisphaerales bacterium]
VAGVPVVASAIGGIVDYVLPDRNGITFPAGDLEELVRAIRAAAAHPLFSQGQVEPDTLRQMREYLSPKKMATEFFAGYERVVSKD